jgi:hypothetical protein
MQKLLFLVIVSAALAQSDAFSSWNVPNMRSLSMKGGHQICMAHESSSSSRRSFLTAVGEWKTISWLMLLLKQCKFICFNHYS